MSVVKMQDHGPAASRFVGVPFLEETMKRAATSKLYDPTYAPKKRKTVSKWCQICKTPEKHLHRLSAGEAATLSRMYDLHLTSANRVCCRHYEYHTKEVFSKNQRPALRQDATAYHTAPSTRKPPAKRIHDVAPVEAGMWSLLLVLLLC